MVTRAQALQALEEANTTANHENLVTVCKALLLLEGDLSLAFGKDEDSFLTPASVDDYGSGGWPPWLHFIRQGPGQVYVEQLWQVCGTEEHGYTLGGLGFSGGLPEHLACWVEELMGKMTEPPPQDERDGDEREQAALAVLTALSGDAAWGRHGDLLRGILAHRNPGGFVPWGRVLGAAYRLVLALGVAEKETVDMWLPGEDEREAMK